MKKMYRKQKQKMRAQNKIILLGVISFLPKQNVKKKRLKKKKKNVIKMRWNK